MKPFCEKIVILIYMEDNTLIMEMKKGQSFERFIDLYASVIFSVIRRMIFNRQVHDDIAQDVLMKIAQNIPKFRGDSKLSTWVYTITYRRCLDFLNTEKKNILTNTQDLTDYNDIGTEDDSDSLVESIDIEKSLRDVPEKYRIFVSMRYIDGITLREIAEITGLSVGAVKTRVHRGIDMLRDNLIKMET